MLLVNNMKLTKEKLQQIIKEEMGGAHTFSSDEMSEMMLGVLPDIFDQIKDGMHRMKDKGNSAELKDTYDQLKAVLKSVKEK